MKRIAYKFASAIIGLTLIAAIALGLLANTLTNITESSQQVMNNEVEKINMLHGIYGDYLAMYMKIYAHINVNLVRTMDKYAEEIMAQRDELWESMEVYEAGITSAEVQTTYDLLKDGLVNFDAYVDKIIDYSRKGNKDMANAMVSSNLSKINYGIDTNMTQLLEYSNQELENGKLLLTQKTEESYMVIIASIGLLVVAAILVMIISIRVIVVPIRKIAVVINRMIEDIHNGQGKLTGRVPVQTKDEISTLAKGVNEFLDILQEMIGGVISCSEEIDRQQKNVNEVVEETNLSASETSATMEELAASIEEVSSTAVYVNENTRLAESSVTAMVDKAVSGTKFAEEIRNRAEELRKLAQNSKQTASGMIREFDMSLQASIEDSHQIENIGNLTGDILNIASKTNLLALNASIEAARAGEAGKGFAVVADEIRVLADNSKETANNIQQISQSVVDAVMTLAENANNLVKFINERILPDYEILEQTGEQYLNDSITVDQMMGEIRDSMEDIGGMMREVAQSNENITNNVQESAQGVTGVVSNTTALVDNMQNIIGALDQVSNVVSHLSEQTACFQA